MQKKKRSHIGLDIGSRSLKVIELLTDQKTVFVKKVGIQELPQGSSANDLLTALKSLLSANGINTKEVNTSISGPGVVVRFIELPLMPDAEVSQAIPYEAEKYIPFDVKDVILDYAILEKDQTNKKMKVLLVGAKKNFVEIRIKQLSEIGLIPNVIDVDSFAIFNAFINNLSANERGDKIIALLNISAHSANIIVACRDVPSMVRDVNFGQADLAQALEEIKRSFTYYENQYGKPIEEVYISGEANLDEITQSLKEATGLECKTWDPLGSFAISSRLDKEVVEKHKSALAVCSGLVLRK